MVDGRSSCASMNDGQLSLMLQPSFKEDDKQGL